LDFVSFFAQEVAGPVSQLEELQAVDLVDARVDDAAAGSPFELVEESFQLLVELVRFLHRLVSNPARTFHEFNLLQVAALCNSFNSSESFFENLILFIEHSSLSFGFVICEDIFDIVSVVILLCFVVKATTNLRTRHTFLKKSLLKVLLKLHNLNIVFVSDTGNLLEMSVFKNGVGITEEIVDEEATLLSTVGDLHDLCAVRLN